MLEYFTYKKIKKHKTEKEAKEGAKHLSGSEQASANLCGQHAVQDRPAVEKHAKRRDIAPVEGPSQAPPPVLRPEDEWFLQQLVDGNGRGSAPPPVSPEDLSEFGLPSDTESAAPATEPGKTGEAHKETGNLKDGSPKTADKDKKPGRLSVFFTRSKKGSGDGLEPLAAVPPAEGDRETKDLSRILNRLNLSAKNNKVLSTDASAPLQRFTQVFKDLVNGVPTAYDDLTKLIEDRDGTLSKGFDKLPSSLQKLVTQLPDKITKSLGPEILAAAAAKHGIQSDAQGGVKGVAKSILMPHNLAELVSKPGAIVGMLRAIVEVLKTRWPAFIGMNVLWSVALSLLLFMLWYCHKRGREVRLEREQLAAAIDGSDRIEELPDEPTLPAPEEARVADVSGRALPAASSGSVPGVTRRRDTVPVERR